LYLILAHYTQILLLVMGKDLIMVVFHIQKDGNGTKEIIITKGFGIADFQVIIGVLIFIMELGILLTETLTKGIRVIILQIGNIIWVNISITKDGTADYLVTTEVLIFIMALGIPLMGILITEIMDLFLQVGNGIKENIIIKEAGTVGYQVLIAGHTFEMVLGILLMEIQIIQMDILQVGKIIKVNIITVEDGIVDCQVSLTEDIFIEAPGTLLIGNRDQVVQDTMMETPEIKIKRISI